MTISDSICIASPFRSSTSAKKYIIFFLTGNPGLIGYYDIFLIHLHALLSEDPGDAENDEVAFEVHGSSLPGFETEELGDEERRRRWRCLGLEDDAPFSLDHTIRAIEQNVFNIINKSEENADASVILIGHSLGAFIALEVIERHRKRLEIRQAVEGEPPIVGGIGLFPCIFEMRQSRSGIMLQKLAQLPFFKTGLPRLLYFLICLIPLVILAPLVRLITRMPKNAAAVTTAFLKSPKGIRSALHLACDEIETITTDKWSDETWGATHPSPTGVPRPKLYFLFGEKDHWVSEKTRDELILMKGGEENWRPKMELDKTGLPHGFCIEHSVPVAEKVAGYIREVVRSG
ncbi:Lipid droplet-associated hydrolase [Venturia nashicola]|uniref:Lipid droplet-associated hydrolase n=1 Tax=Venturia nashicola TaxID=86259 RepID=A0A4Z1P3D1_9PEZI|nr:Lipid droplet-associated hydrolase [Venturia nashicola]TLD23651.1 Lipid droplet-associated hydrolase [Venturia nashicola]